MNRARYIRVWLAIALLMVVVGSSATAFGQTASPPAVNGPKRVNLYSHLLGSVELPDGFSGYMTNDWMDAWAGHIESPTGFKLIWRAGLVTKALEDSKDKIEWIREEKVGDLVIKRASVKEAKGKTLVTSFGWLEFSAPIRNEDDEKTFTLLTESYKKEKCVGCRSLPRRIKN
ncbi:MAG: hypothetical protein ABIR33_04745 [Pyrinomonadaceae bacterium]